MTAAGAPGGPRGQDAPRVALVNLGCRVNRVEIDLFASRLERAGCVLADAAQADLVVINTCAVTGEAQTKTRKAVRRAARLPQAPVVLATGCVASLFADELRAVAPGVVVEPDKGRVVVRALAALGRGEDYVDDAGQLAVSPTPTGRTRPGVKIQDGCDNRCSFCLVWKARGASRSLPSAQVADAVREACGRGAHEVVLTGINLGSYRAGEGDALGAGARLPELLAFLLRETDIDRLRLSSIEPPDVTDVLLAVMADSRGRVAPFLHVCLQSGCDATLRRMRRVYTAEQFARVVRHARSYLPGIALGTDLIVGFPGETDEEFGESRSFCEEMAFARMHVFRYSRRPGTWAATAPGQVPAPVAAWRGEDMRELAARLRAEQIALHAGERDRVLVQAPGHAVDSRLFDVAVDPRLEVGQLVSVQLELAADGTLIGR